MSLEAMQVEPQGDVAGDAADGGPCGDCTGADGGPVGGSVGGVFDDDGGAGDVEGIFWGRGRLVEWKR
jgi:hypothetical protein